MCLKQLYVELSAVFYPAGMSLVSVKTFQVWLKSVISTHEVKASRSAPSCLLQTLITQLHFILSIFLFKWWKLPSFFPFCRLKSNRASSQQKPHRHRLSFIAIMFFKVSVVTFSFTLVASDGKKGLKDSLIKRFAEDMNVAQFHPVFDNRGN